MAVFLIPVYMWPQRWADFGWFLLQNKILAIGTWATFSVIFADISIVNAQKILSFYLQCNIWLHIWVLCSFFTESEILSVGWPFTINVIRIVYFVPLLFIIFHRCYTGWYWTKVWIWFNRQWFSALQPRQDSTRKPVNEICSGFSAAAAAEILDHCLWPTLRWKMLTRHAIWGWSLTDRCQLC